MVLVVLKDDTLVIGTSATDMHTYMYTYMHTYCMVGNFCGVQIFVDFSSHLIHENLLNFSYTTK